MGSARYPTYPAVTGLGDQLAHFFDRLSALPMPDHMMALIEELERAHSVNMEGELSPLAVQAAD